VNVFRDKVGAVTSAEKNEIIILYEKRLALNDLLLTLDDPMLTNDEKNLLHDRIIGDIKKAEILYHQWWGEKSRKYNWRFDERGKWSINFQTSEVFLEILT
jgi:CXXX repeat modification system protein